LAEFVNAVAKSTQTSTGLGVMMVLAAVAACVQGKVEVSGGGDHIEPVAIWTCTSLPPASRKTPVVNLITAPLKNWEKSELARKGTLIERTACERAVVEGRISELMKSASKKENREARAKLVDEIEALRASMPAEIKPPMLFTGDVTPEALQGLMVDHQERMAVIADEGGIFEVMTGLYSDGKVNLDVFLQGHAGSPVRVNRTSRAVNLSRPALTFGLTVQPSLIAELGNGNKKRLRGNGALARFLYCVPASNVGSRNVREQSSVSESVKYRYSIALELLLNFQPSVDEYGRPQPILLSLESDAMEAYFSFAQQIEDRQGPGKEFEGIADWTGKLPGAVLRIAGLCHCAEFGPGKQLISKATINRAIKLAWLLIEHAKVAFDSMAIDPAIDDAKYLATWIKSQGEAQFNRRYAHRLGRFTNSPGTRLDRALELLIERNMISHQQTLETRKPTLIYLVNPKYLSS
jgi:putative DNA primase/helicase